MPVKADPFWVILEFQLAWVLDFYLWPKKWEIQSFLKSDQFTYCSWGFFESRSPKYTNIDRNRTISTRYAMLVLFLMLFRELESMTSMILKVALGLLLIFSIFRNLLLKKIKL